MRKKKMRKQLLHDLERKRGYWSERGSTLWRTRFGEVTDLSQDYVMMTK